MAKKGPCVSQGEFDQHVSAFDRLVRRVDDIDRDGTRGVGRVEIQVNEMTKDMAELKTAAATWQTRHEAEHKSETRDKRVGRRWMIGTAVAGLAVLVAIVAMVAQILGRPAP